MTTPATQRAVLAELRRLAGRAATRQQSAVVLLRGEAGIGKTTMLDALEAEFRPGVVRCAGMQAEAEFGYAGLTELLYAGRDAIRRLSPAHVAALEAVMGTAPAENVSRLVVAAATLAWMAEAASHRPLLVLVDDAQWLDEASAVALLFAVRRLRAESVAVVIAVRDGVPSAFDAAGPDVLRVPGLDPGESRDLVLSVYGGALGRDVTDRLWRETGGNPLALTEIARRADALARYEPLAPFGGAPAMPVGDRLHRVYRGDLEKLPPPVRVAVTVAAASYTDEACTTLGALAHLGLPAETLTVAETAGLLGVRDGRILFRHPLVRSAAYHAATAAERRAAHRALAAALATLPGPAHRAYRAWHLAAAATGHDPDAAAALAEVGRDEQRRGSMVTAAQAYQRGADLAPDGDTGVRLLVAAAHARLLGGDGTSAQLLLDRAAGIAAAGPVAGEIAEVRAQLALVREPPRQVHDRFVAWADQLPLDVGQTAALLVAAAGAACMGGEVRQAHSTAARARSAAATVGDPLAGAASVLAAQASMLAGAPVDARRFLDGCREFLDLADPLAVGTEVFSFATMSLMWLEDYAGARRLLARVVDRVRAAAAPERLPPLLSVAAEMYLRTGRWNEAYVTAAEAVTIGEELAIKLPTAYAMSTLARVDAARGNAAECAARIAGIRHMLRDSGAELVEPYADLAEALAHLSAGRPADAAASLHRTAGRATATGLREATVLRHHPDLVDALIEAGDPAGARAVLSELTEWLTAAPTAWGRAAEARCTAMLAGQDDAHEEALRLHAGLPDPFATARAHLAYGCHLRRTKRRAAAREQLTAALHLLTGLHAVPWQDRVLRELRAAGVGASRQPARTVELTSQEAQIAMSVAEGRTNREVAALMYLSVKTVEYHLGHVYAKLGIRSRTELARHFGPPV